MRENLSSGTFKKFLLDLKGLNRALKLCIAILIVYLVGYFTMSVSRLKEVPEFESKNSRGSAEFRTSGTLANNVAHYLEGPRGRNIFKFGDVTEEAVKEIVSEEVAPPVEEKESPAETLSNQLGLVGIGWSDDPDVMVENVDTKKMYFLKKGQRIDGLIKVEAIFEDKVILTYDNGKEMELR